MNPQIGFQFYRFYLLILVSAFFVGGCTLVPTGKWEVDTSAQNSFKSGALLADHTYYYLGSYAMPDTVIAINNHYVLRNENVWTKVDKMSDKVLKGWLTMFKTTAAVSLNYSGGVILTPGGQQAGVWYSRYIVNLIEMPEPGVLVVYQPHPIGTIGETTQPR